VMFLVLGHLGFKAAWPLQSFIFPVWTLHPGLKVGATLLHTQQGKG
jgi:hypothetical protein